LVQSTELEIDSPVKDLVDVPVQEKLGPEVDPPMHLNSVLGDQEQPQNNSGTIRDTELFEASPLATKPYEKKGKGGRERSYEKVRKVIMFRYKLGHYHLGLSDDMRLYYDYWYFSRPNKAKDGQNYERHVKTYKRGRQWIKEEKASAKTENARDGTMGHSSTDDLSEDGEDD